MPALTWRAIGHQSLPRWPLLFYLAHTGFFAMFTDKPLGSKILKTSSLMFFKIRQLSHIHFKQLGVKLHRMHLAVYKL